MNVVDSSGWLEFFVDGPNAKAFEGAIKNESTLIVPIVCIYEVYKKIKRDYGESEAIEAVAFMMQRNVIEMNEAIVLEAADLSLDLHLPMADSMILATARLHGATLLTQDAHFEGVTGVTFIPKKLA
jgi:predicted nucleic acid-binding protein